MMSTDEVINSKVREINNQLPTPFSLNFLKTKSSAVQFLNYELPEINILFWDDKSLDIPELVNIIKGDPWLHYAATIFILGETNEQQTLRKIEGTNMVAIIPQEKIAYFLPRVLAVLHDNRELLNQWNFHALVTSSLAGKFNLNRDAFDIITHTSLLGNFMYNSNLIDNNDKERFNVLMLEYLMKAVSYVGSSTESKLTLVYQIEHEKSTFRMSLNEADFNWEKEIPLPTDRGKLTTSFHRDGTELMVSIDHSKGLGQVVPKFFEAQTVQEFEPGETVFQQGEESNHLFFIVHGDFEVLVGEKRVTVLDPSDVFMGEMSFLLKNRRTATVKSLGHGKLIKISKQEFIDSLKEKPHYGFFLSRMLAERIVELHKNRF
jgi:hypothetical protein